MSQQNPTPKNKPSFLGGLLAKLSLLIVSAGAAGGGTYAFAEDLPPVVSDILGRGQHALLGHEPFTQIPNEFQLSAVAAGGTAVLVFALYIALVFYRNPKIMTALTVLVAVGGGYVYWSGAPSPNPGPDPNPPMPGPTDPSDPNTLMIDIVFKNETKSSVAVMANGKEFGRIGGYGDKRSLKLPAFALVHFEPTPALPNGRVIPDVQLGNGPDLHVLRGDKTLDGLAGKLVPYYRANKYSYDIRFVDPFNIDAKTVSYKGKRYPGALRKRIFEDFNELTDSTHHFRRTDVSGYFIEKHFNSKNLNEGWVKIASEAYGSAQSLREGFNAAISADAEFGPAKGSLNAAFNHVTSTSSAENSVYFLTQAEKKLYQVFVMKKDIRLTKEFKQAVRALPTSRGRAYSDFIRDWGTHYPNAVTYGGAYVQVNEVSGGSFADMLSSGFSLGGSASVPLKGGSVGGSADFGWESNSTYDRYFQNSVQITQYKGGELTGGTGVDAYSVKPTDVQPIAIDFEGCRLSTLLTAATFADGAEESFLRPRRELLAEAEKAVVSSDDYQEQKTRIVEVHVKSMQRIPKPGEIGYTPYVNGRVILNIYRHNNTPVLGVNDHILYNPTDRTVEMKDSARQKFSLQPQIVFATKTPEKFRAGLYIDLKFNHNSYRDGHWGPNTLFTKPLSRAMLGGVVVRENLETSEASNDWGKMRFQVEIKDKTIPWFKN